MGVTLHAYAHTVKLAKGADNWIEIVWQREQCAVFDPDSQWPQSEQADAEVSHCHPLPGHVATACLLKASH
jgi:hypothetical protein